MRFRGETTATHRYNLRFHLVRSTNHNKTRSMPVYVISEISAILEPALMEKYRTLAQASIKQYGGRYIVRGGAIEKVEGEAPHAVVIVEFPSMERAREWCRSPEYAEALAIRPCALNRRLLFVEGV
jgi:uncharacterized protein (DUF1330 family)